MRPARTDGAHSRAPTNCGTPHRKICNTQLSEPCAQPSSRTSMPLCFRYARIASCDLSSMLFPMAICLLVLGPAPLARLVVRMAPAGKRQCKGGSKTRMHLSFPGAPRASRKSFCGPCARATVGESSLPRRDGVGRARGGCPWECGDGACCEVLRTCVPGVWWRCSRAGRLLSASQDGGALLRMPCGAWWLCP